MATPAPLPPKWPFCAILPLALTACGGSGPKAAAPTGSGSGAAVSADIGPAGGRIEAPDGSLPDAFVPDGGHHDFDQPTRGSAPVRRAFRPL